MSDYVTLLGAEDVRSASRTMEAAAQSMRNSADTISFALTQHQQFLQAWLAEYRDIVRDPTS